MTPQLLYNVVIQLVEEDRTYTWERLNSSQIIRRLSTLLKQDNIVLYSIKKAPASILETKHPLYETKN